MKITNRLKAKDAYVFFHDNCPDGIVSAIIATEGLKARPLDNPGREVWPIPVTYNQKLLIPAYLAKNAEIYFVDFCPSPDVLKALVATEPSSITVLDHHQKMFDMSGELNKACKRFASSLTDITLIGSLSDSGSTLAWHHFKDRMREDDRLRFERIADYIRIYDLWLHAGDNNHAASELAVGYAELFMRDTFKMGFLIDDAFKSLHEVKNYLYEQCTDTIINRGNEAVFKKYAVNMANVIKSLFNQGFKQLRHCGRTKIDSIIKRSGDLIEHNSSLHRIVVDQLYRFLIVSDVDGELVNEVSSQARKFSTSFTCCVRESHGKLKLSFRAGVVSSIDLNALTGAISPTGGGHHDAAGVTIPMTQNTYPNNASIQEIVEVIDRALSAILSKK